MATVSRVVNGNKNVKHPKKVLEVRVIVWITVQMRLQSVAWRVRKTTTVGSCHPKYC